MEIVDVVIPTLNRPHRKLCETYLKNMPFPVNVIWATEGKSWPEAVNAGFRQCSGERDVLLMDDDIFISPTTFSLLPENYQKADIFGFKLLFPNGLIQHAGGQVRGGRVGHRHFQEPDNGQADTPMYCCHLTTSLIYFKRHVIELLGGMTTEFPGMQLEDVDFCFRAFKAGLRLLYLPGPAIHLESGTKKDLPMFRIKLAQNLAEIDRRYLSDATFTEQLEKYPVLCGN